MFQFEVTLANDAGEVTTIPPEQGRATAQVITMTAVGEPVTRATVIQAVRAALASHERGGTIVASAGAGRAARSAPWWQRWWVWAGVAAVATTAAVTVGVATRDRTERWQIYVPPPWLPRRPPRLGARDLGFMAICEISCLEPPSPSPK